MSNDFRPRRVAPALLLVLSGLACRCGGDAVVSDDAGSGSTDPHCTAPSAEFVAQYEECLAANDEPGCVAAGGQWRTFPIHPFQGCFCPTGQGDCPCTGPSQCLAGDCLVPSNSPSCPVYGLCNADSMRPPGCFCSYHDAPPQWGCST